MSLAKVAFIFAASLMVWVRPAGAAVSFAGAEPFTVSAKPDSTATADFNGDGNDDVVTVARRSDEINILLGDDSTPTRFASGTVLRFGKQLSDAAVGDLNGDGRPDIVVPEQGRGAKGVWILLGRGDGSFSSPDFASVGERPFAAAIANFDGTRGNDIVIADPKLDGVIIGLNDGQNPPGFNFLPRITTGNGPEEIVAADINGDGHPDIVTLNLSGPIVKDVGVLLFENVTATFPVFSPVRNFGVGERPFSLISADFNRDGRSDVAVLNRGSVGVVSDEIQVLLARADGTLGSPRITEVPCPFFAGGRLCGTRQMTAGDFNFSDASGAVNNLDVAVILVDPRTIATHDAFQVYSGRGDGTFVGGPAFPVGKNPTAISVGDIIGNRRDDLVVATRSPTNIAVQAFVNISTAGDKGNGEECFAGDECLSGRCTSGVCCAVECRDLEVCNAPGQEGVCVRVDPPVECFDDFDCEGFGRCEDNPEILCFDSGDCALAGGGVCQVKVCRDGFCCDRDCNPLDERCDIPGFEGICTPRSEEGEPCFDDTECSTGFCRDGRCCNQDCQLGVCNVPGLEGECQPLLPNGEFCDDDDRACLSGVCDDFDLICCNRACFEDEFCNEEGRCTAFDFATPTSVPTEDPNATPTVTPTPSGDQGTSCTDGSTCDDGLFCVDNVCCEVDQCSENQHCELGSGTCVEGPAPSATPTATPTPSATGTGGGSGTTRTRTVLPGNCDANCPPQNCQPDGTCILSSRSGGCSTGKQTADGRDALMLSLLPIGLWLGRRWQMRHTAARVRIRIRK